MSTTLDFASSEAFRKKIITRNLAPYPKSPRRTTPPINFEYIQSDLAVTDSPDGLIDDPSLANKLYPLNQYGADGGYKQVPDPSALLNSKSNEGEYGYQDANLVDESLIAAQKGFPGIAPAWQPLNAYAGQNFLDSSEVISTLETVRVDQDRLPNGNPYQPLQFVPSSYGPVSILLNPDPQGSNGLLSSDSFIQRFGASNLKKLFLDRIATQIRRETVGRANVFNVRSGTDILNLVTGRVPLIEPNYQITIPANPIVAATDFALRLAGSYIPVSPIPGSYWDTSVNQGQPTTIQQLQNAFKRSDTGKFFTRLLGANKTGSQIMYNNMGGGQKSRLFGNIDYNKYKPSFDRTLFDRVGGVIAGSTTNNSNFYVGSNTSDPSKVFSPEGQIPVNEFGVEQQSPVYGPSELAQLYEGPSQEVRLGANGPTYSNGGGIEGGFTWVSPKYRGNAGKKVGIGGDVTNIDEDFKPSSYNSTESTNREFREGSILDDTQRIIESQPQGGKRLQHVGNAIDQVSKVFHDGYKEMTKGSRVLSYVGSFGNEVGTEYCRVFAKDVPYLQYNDLQKTDGMTTEGRKFSYSVLDKTYNLNIAPNKREGGQDSSNLIGTGNAGYAKKYMFSLENLAWRTSSTPGYTVNDLPMCERGPNGGRVMWFPPYGLTFNENISANWKGNDFIGRPEPIYTYSNTNRTGSISWKIVVDHPSVLNMIVNKVLSKESNAVKVNSILDSFFAGCRKYDLYELAKRYYTINPQDLYQLQQIITSKEMSKEQLGAAVKSQQSGVEGTREETKQSTPQANTTIDWTKVQNMNLFFDNDFPQASGTLDYTTLFGNYYGQKSVYAQKDTSTSPFFDKAVNASYQALNQFKIELAQTLEQNPNGTVSLIIDSSCSAPQTEEYNKKLSERRITSMIEYFTKDSALTKYVTSSPQRLVVKAGTPFGEVTSSTPQAAAKESGPFTLNDFSPWGQSFNCSDKNLTGALQVKGGDVMGPKEVFTIGAMACRRAFISKVEQTLTQAPPVPKGDVAQEQPKGVLTGTVSPKPLGQTQLETTWVEKDNITKRVLRGLLSECDYFETIKEDTPMVYDNLKDKLKFFQPAFHSMTPEGLNSRLTFLQQCMRPGDTIPTVKQSTPQSKPELEYNNAINTAFGSPPVLVLRVGDFYHTKIIPTSLSFTYEDLDINPEGIGVQPMIANVTLSFNFVGGSGLKQAVDKLQNALTFNYYANTEVYDDRADATDESFKVLDKNFLNSIGAQPPRPTVNQAGATNGLSNNNTIGNILTNIKTETTETGTISYKEFMDKVVEQSQTYFQNIVNKSTQIVDLYNNGILQLWTTDRNYIDGTMLATQSTNQNTQLVGKPEKLETKINKIFNDYISDIKSNNDGEMDRFIKFMKSPNKNFNPKVIRELKNNMETFVKGRKNTFQNSLTQVIQEITNQQQTFIQYLSRTNVILYQETTTTGSDGLQQANGNVKAYEISGTTNVYKGSGYSNTYDELYGDLEIISSGLTEFYSKVTEEFDFPVGSKNYSGYLVWGQNGVTDYNVIKDRVFIPFSTDDYFTIDSFRRQYVILSEMILDTNKYQTFKNAIIANIKSNKNILDSGNTDLDGEFDSYWLTIAKPKFEEENRIAKDMIKKMSDSTLKNFINYTPFPSKERVLNYELLSDTTTQKYNGIKKMVQSLGTTNNPSTEKKSWNIESDINDAYVSMIKLN
jgi:hypothetical protein